MWLWPPAQPELKPPGSVVCQWSPVVVLVTAAGSTVWVWLPPDALVTGAGSTLWVCAPAVELVNAVVVGAAVAMAWFTPGVALPRKNRPAVFKFAKVNVVAVLLATKADG